jgi:hypothetical protein
VAPGGPHDFAFVAADGPSVTAIEFVSASAAGHPVIAQDDAVRRWSDAATSSVLLTVHRSVRLS